MALGKIQTLTGRPASAPRVPKPAKKAARKKLPPAPVALGRIQTLKGNVRRLLELRPDPRSLYQSLVSRPGLYSTAAGLVLVIAVTAVLRLWDLGGIGLRGDEAVYAGQASVISGDDTLSRYFILVSRGTSNFLLFQYVLAAYYFVFGVSDVGARLVSAMFSIVTVVATFELARTLYGRRVAFLAALLLAVSSYSVALGRLALLDSMMTFFFVLTVLCLAKWWRTKNPLWVYGFAAAAALAIQAKVTAGLVLPVSVLFVVSSGELRSINARTALKGAAVFVFFMLPAVVHLVQNADRLPEFFADSSGRASHVPWDYYISTLVGYEGVLLPLIWAAGAAAVCFRAAKTRAPEDLLCVAWILVVGLFFQWYRLKAFNYLLPLVPVLSIAGAHFLGSILTQKLGHARVAVVGLAFLGSLFVPLNATIADDSYVGLREASYWLAENTPADAGVMTISRGSAQYVISFYGHRDSYPFGKFRLATVVPGGAVIEPRATGDGPSRDWVSYWPRSLIASKTVSYFVFYTDAGDDPPDEEIVNTQTQREFRDLIETYNGGLVHTVYYNHEPRVWIYQVGRLLPQARISFTLAGNKLNVRGEGFRIESEVSISYHRIPLGTAVTDGDGTFAASFPAPRNLRALYYLRAMDEAGNSASSTGRHIWGTNDVEPVGGFAGGLGGGLTAGIFSY